MRRTLTVLVASAALLVPATAASAATSSNASCNNGKGGNYAATGAEYNEKGNGRNNTGCGDAPGGGLNWDLGGGQI